MPTLTRRQKFIIVAGSLILLTMVGLVILNQPQTSPTTQSPPNKLSPPDLTTGFSRITPPSATSQLTPLKPLPPESLVYQQKAFSASPLQINRFLLEKGFQNPTQVDSYITASSDTNQTVVFNTQTGTVTLFQTQNPIPAFTQESLTLFAETIINLIIPPHEIWQNPHIQINYFTAPSNEQLIPSSSQTATIAVIDIFPTIKDIKIVDQNSLPLGQKGPLSLTLNKNTREISATTSFIGVDTTTSQLYPLKSIKAVEQELAQTNPPLTSLIPVGQSYKTIERGEDPNPQKVTYTTIGLVYYYDSRQENFIQPVYLITGNTILQNGQPAVAQSIIPAIDSQYLK